MKNGQSLMIKIRKFFERNNPELMPKLYQVVESKQNYS